MNPSLAGKPISLIDNMAAEDLIVADLDSDIRAGIIAAGRATINLHPSEYGRKRNHGRIGHGLEQKGCITLVYEMICYFPSRSDRKGSPNQD